MTMKQRHESNEQEIRRVLDRLKLVEVVRAAALPVAALGAGFSLALTALAFPIAAAAVAVFVGVGEWFVRREKKELMQRITSLERGKDVSPESAQQMVSTLNRIAIGGPSE